MSTTAPDALSVTAAAAAAVGIPVISGDHVLDPDAVRLARRVEGVVGVSFSRGLPIIVFPEAPSPAQVSDVELGVGCTIVPALAPSQKDWQALSKAAAALFDTAPTTPIERLLDYGLANNASDVHIAVGQRPWMRVAGELVPLDVDDWSVVSPDDADEMARWVLGDGFDFDSLGQDYDTSVSFGTCRFRVSVLKARGNRGLVLRAIPMKVPEFRTLGIPPKVLEFAGLAQGIVLVCGITGSGKSTTLASLLHHINTTRAAHIVTIEDPIEFVHTSDRSLIRQREVGEDADTKDFATGIRHVLRQDPDVIQIGEMRDLESIRAALTAAETGHLVFSTIHANDAPGVVNRIIDQFPADEQNQIRTQLAATLKGVVCQSLVPTEKPGGRVAVCEVMSMTTGISANIRDGHTEQIAGAVETGRKLGMQSHDWALADTVRRGKVARDVALRFVHNDDAFNRYLHSETDDL
ncbi:MAG TPA: PilT/PilU family type 4a pilus ATPase [Acidimicrobiales bacterium]|nr:PilT/PilU family type 4a pilus ATPase [Acidimicrobiales bacterium]